VQRLAIVTLAEVPEASRCVLDSLAIRAESGDPAKGVPDTIH
jgi:hypothetical protein